MNVLVWCRYVRVFVFVCLFFVLLLLLLFMFLFFLITREAPIISKFVFIPQEPVFPTAVTTGKDTPTQGDRDERCMARFFPCQIARGPIDCIRPPFRVTFFGRIYGSLRG